jgi:hypothetical protein
MSIQVLGFDGNPFDQNSIEAAGGRFLKTLVRLALSGSYVTGGDTLDLTNAGGTVAAPNTVPNAQSRGLVQIDVRPISKLTTSFAAAGGQYEIISAAGVVPIPLANIATALKLKLILIGGGEYSAGAYGADALGDLIEVEIYWAR